MKWKRKSIINLWQSVNAQQVHFLFELNWLLKEWPSHCQMILQTVTPSEQIYRLWSLFPQRKNSAFLYLAHTDVDQSGHTDKNVLSFIHSCLHKKSAVHWEAKTIQKYFYLIHWAGASDLSQKLYVISTKQISSSQSNQNSHFQPFEFWTTS